MKRRFSGRTRTQLIVVAAAVLLVAGGVFADFWSAQPVGVQTRYVGRSACIDCHVEQAESYQGSHHDLAMDHATEASVLGDFDDATLEHDGVVSRMYRDGDRFMIRTEGESGEIEDFEIKYVFGVSPLQQYMVEFDRDESMSPDEVARVQVLRVSWDDDEKRWFYLRPPDVDDKLAPDDPLHWTGIAQRWQTMCAECHSTNLQRNYDPATTTYHTTYSEIDVSCESCHGPGSLHVELANSNSLFWDRRYGTGLTPLSGDDPTAEIESCAPCHARRGVLDHAYRPGRDFTDFYDLELLRAATYHDDGQIKDEDYVYGSFIQSKMYHQGVRCTDCHDPHSLKLKHEGNETCTSCHQHSAGKYDVPAHHHHAVGTAGSMCVDCHMPHTTYMAIDERRDHSLRVPRPDLSVRLGTPNACSGCHVADQLQSIAPEKRAGLAEYADWLEAAAAGDEEVRDAIAKTDVWCDQACDDWYGAQRKTPRHFAEALVAFRRGEAGAVEAMLKLASLPDELAPPIARATALMELGDNRIAVATEQARDVLADASQSPMVRAAAVSVFAALPPERAVGGLREYLDDPSRLVRRAVARTLVTGGGYSVMNGTDRFRVDQALDEVRDGLMSAPDTAGAHLMWAVLCEMRGRTAEAIESYRTAMRVQPTVAGPRTNLASLLERSGRDAGEIRRLRREELPLLKRDAALAPGQAPIQARAGYALYLDGQLAEALTYLMRAKSLDPRSPDYRAAVDQLTELIGRNATSGD